MLTGEMMGRRAWVIVVLAALFVAMATGLLWWQAERSRIQMRAELLAQAEQRSMQLADAMAGQIDALIGNIDLGLQQLRREWTLDRRHFDAMARDVMAMLPGSAVTHISVADASGNIVYNSLDPGDRPFVGDREHFKIHRSGEDRLYIGKPVLSRITNAWSFVVNRPLLSNGRFAGTMNFVVRTDYLASRMSGLLLEEEDIVALVHADDGAFLARSRDNTKAMGVKVPPDRPFLRAEANWRGTFRTEGTIDSAPRTFGWYRLSHFSLIAIVGLDDNAVLAPMTGAMAGGGIRGAGIAVPVVALLGVLIVALLLRVGLQQAVISRDEERLRQAVRLSQLGIFDEDHRQGRCFWSPALRSAFGWKDERREFADFLAAVDPEDREKVAAAFRRSHDPAGDGQLDVTCRALRADGRMIWLEVKGETFFEGEGASRRKTRTVGATLDISAFKAAEARSDHLLGELNARMEQLRLITDNVPAMIAFYDSAQICRFCNRAYAEARGYVQDEVVGRTLREVVGETRYALTLPSYRKVLSGEVVRTQRMRDDLGPDLRFLESVLMPLVVDGGVAGVITMQINVTEREVAAERLRENIRQLNEQMVARREAEEERDRLTAIIDATTDLVSMADPAGNVTYFNRAGRAMIAVGEKPLSEIRIKDVHPEWATEVIMEQGIPGAVRDGYWSGETALLAPDGRETPVSQVILSHKDDQGSLLFLSTIMRDISERKRAEVALRESEARLREAQRLARIGSWELDLASHRLVWSDEVFRIFEIDPARFPASYEGFIDAIHPEDRERVSQAYLESVSNRQPYQIVHRLLMKDGRIKYVRENGVTHYDGERAQRSVGTVQDITDIHEAEERLRQLNEELEGRVAARKRELSVANRELEAFAYSVSHDLRTPLRGIDGFARLLEEQHGEGMTEEARGFLQRIRSATQRMGQLITDLLELSRVSRVELRRERVDLSAMAREVADDIARGAPERRVEWQIAEGLSADADPRLVRIVLENLLGNAWKYTARNKSARVTFCAAQRGGSPEFCVSDDGAGFDMAHADLLFQPFRRLHGHHEFEGTGVGLATVHRVIEKHGGRIRGEGAVGRGAAFYFSFAG